MAFQKLNAVMPASPGAWRGTARSGGVSGVQHANVPLTDNFTVVSNRLAQHGQLSLLAIGTALHIQSLPEGARVSIRTLADRFPETEHRIGRALRELEAAGFLCRTRLRTVDGRVVTRTVSYNSPASHTPLRPAREPGLSSEPGPDPEPERAPEPGPGPGPEPDPGPVPESDPGPDPGPEPESAADPEPAPEPETGWDPGSERDPAQDPDPDPGPEPGSRPEADPEPRAAADPAPDPAAGSGCEPGAGPASGRPAAEARPELVPTTALRREAARLLAGLRVREPRLLLAERDVERLVPGVVEWLERGVAYEAVRRALTADVPSDLRNPAGLVAYRLRAAVPPPLPERDRGSVSTPPPDRAIHPFRTCDGCERAFRSPTPATHCGDCTAHGRKAA
ncbi:hypothetical protein OV450_4398 [Actinobacteria bacterium OV450]|nr:hypothetical protein OV450_4398 [Actinobacteria bacterium OV450]